MAVLNKEKNEENSVGMLVIGTENKYIYILDTFGSTVKKNVCEET